MNANNKLDPQQVQMIAMYEQILCDDNILRYLEGVSRSGYLTGVVYKEGTARFIALDTDTYTGYSINELFQWNFLSAVKRMLRDWHTKKIYTYQPRDGRYVNYLESTKSVCIDLTRKQRGILTKILKTENKRKRLLSGKTN